MKTLKPVRYRHSKAKAYGFSGSQEKDGRVNGQGTAGMICPMCGCNRSLVCDARPKTDGTFRRRRVCMQCQARFTTVEIYLPDLDYVPDFQI